VKRAHAAVASLVSTPVATLAAPMPKQGEQYPLGNLIADATRAAAKSNVGVMNNGGIRSGLARTTVTYGDAFDVLPLDNRLVSLGVTGAQLRQYIESSIAQLRDGEPRIHVSGIVVRFDTVTGHSPRIKQITIEGKPLDDARRYTVAMNDFMTTIEPGLTLARNASQTLVMEPTLLEAFIDYLRARPQPVVAPTDARFVPVP
jgi:5'-nucleotidase